MEHSRPSSSTLIGWLNSTNRPFVLAAETASCEEWQSDPDKKWFVLDGKEMPDWTAAFRSLRKVFHLPDYCGNNLNALSECLSDADVLQGSAFVVQIQNAPLVLNAANSDAMQGLIETLESVAEEWAKPVNVNEPWDRPAIPFHVILCGAGADPRFACYPPTPDSPPSTPRG